MDYQGYLSSDAWANKKRAYRASKLKWECVCCGANKFLDLHHKTYERLGNEKLTDLIPLCRSCHSRTHTKLKLLRARDQNSSKWTLWNTHKLVRKEIRSERRKIPSIDRKQEITCVVDAAEIDAARSANGGWTKLQLAEWGIPWPPPRGWKKRLQKNS